MNPLVFSDQLPRTLLNQWTDEIMFRLMTDRLYYTPALYPFLPLSGVTIQILDFARKN